MTVSKVPLPADALLQTYAQRANTYTDCFAAPATTDLPGAITAFYRSPVFRPEQLILGLAGHPSTADDVAALAAGQITRFAAWRVEARTDDQIMLADVSGATRSWLMARDGTFYFGSAVLRHGPVVSALMPFHALYARALLWAAARRVGAR